MGFTVTYLTVKRLKIQSIFNKNTIKLENNKEYIKKTINIIAILCTKWGCNCKNNILIYFKTALNWTTKIKLIKVIKLLYS